MRKYSPIFLALFFLMSCQSKHLVTHNKRKYTKGYHIPKHKKVKHKGRSNSENVAQKSTYKKNKKVVASTSKTTNQKPNKEAEIAKVEDDLPNDNIEYTPKNDAQNSKEHKAEIEETIIVKDTLKKYPNYDNSRAQLKTSRILTFTSLAFPIPTFILGCIAFWGDGINFELFWPIGLVVFGAVTLVLSIWYLINAVKSKSRRNIVGAVLMLLLSLIAILAGILFFIAFI